MENFSIPFKSTTFDTSTLYELSVLSCLSYLPKEQAYPALDNRDYTSFSVLYDRLRGSQAYVASSDTDVVISIMGKGGSGDCVSDFSFHEDYNGGKTNSISHFSWENLAYKIKRELSELYIEKKRKVWITGHGFGASVATVGAMDLYHSGYIDIGGVYVFGMPRTFNKKLAVKYDRILGKKTFRVVNHNDSCSVSYTGSLGYEHVGTLVYIDENDNVLRKSSTLKLALDRIKMFFSEIFGGECKNSGDQNRHLYARACLKNLFK